MNKKFRLFKNEIQDISYFSMSPNILDRMFCLIFLLNFSFFGNDMNIIKGISVHMCMSMHTCVYRK